MELSKSELIRLLSFMEANLQGSEIVIAALKTERLKKIFFPPVISKCSDYTFKNDVKKNSNNYATIIHSKLQQICQNTAKEDNSNINNYCLNYDSKNTNDRFLDENLNNLTLNESGLKWENYQDYQNQLNSSPYLALCRDFSLTQEQNTDNNLSKAIISNQLYKLKELVKDLLESKCSLQNKLDDSNKNYREALEQLELEREKNIKFQRDKTLNKLEKLEKDKKDIEEELNFYKKINEEEREREKVMIIYLLSERKQLIIRLIEENDRNSELLNLLNKEKCRSSEMEEGLEEESKRSLQMEIDLELLTNNYETEKAQLLEIIRDIQAKNTELELVCDKLKQKSTECTKMTKPLLNNKVIPDLGEGVRSTIVTFNNTITSALTNSKAVVNTHRAAFSVVQSNIHPKPSIANKPNLENINSSIRTPITTVNSSYSTIQPIRVTATRNTDNPQPFATKPLSMSQINSTSNLTSSNQTNERVTSSINNTNISITSTSVASVIQKFSNCSLSSNNIPPPNFKKPQTTALIAGLAQSIGQTTTRNIPAPPIPPNKPILTPQYLKERTSKLLEQKVNNTVPVNSETKN